MKQLWLALTLCSLSTFYVSAQVFVVEKTALCEVMVFNALNLEQPQSMLGFLLLTREQTNELMRGQCSGLIHYPLDAKLSDFILSAHILTKLNQWQSLDSVQKSEVAANLSSFASERDQYAESEEVFDLLRLAVNYESFSLPEAIYVADQIIKKSKNNMALTAAFLMKAEALIRQNKFVEAKSPLFEVVELAKENASNTDNSSSYFYSLLARKHYLSAELHLILGELNIAYSELESAQAIINKHHNIDVRDKITVHDNWGFYYVRLAGFEPEFRHSNLLKAVDKEYQALRIAVQHKAYRQLIVIHNNIAWMYHSLHALESAQRNHLIALNWLQAYPDTERETLIFRSLGRIYQHLGKHEKATTYLSRALTLTKGNAPVIEAKLNCALAKNAMGLNELGNAREYLAKCAALTEEKSADQTMTILLLESQLSDSDVGAQNIERIAALLPQVSNSTIAGEAYLYLANHPSSFDRAELFEKAFEKIELSANLPALFEAYSQAFYKSLQDQRLNINTEFYGKRATAILQQTLRQLEPTESGSAWINNVQSFYSAYIQYVLTVKNDPQRAMELALTLKDINAKSSLKREQEQGANGSASHDYAQKVSELSLDALLNKDLHETQDLSRSVSRELFYFSQNMNSQNLSEDELELYNRQKGTTEIAQMQINEVPLGLFEIASNEAVMLYIVNDENLGLFVQHAQKVSYFNVGSIAAINAQISLVANSLSKRRPSAYGHIQELSKMLLPRSLDINNYQHFVIFPASRLHEVPFSLLLPSARSVTRKFSLAPIKRSREKLSSMALFALSEKPADLIPLDSDMLLELPSLPMSGAEIRSLSERFEGDKVSYIDHMATKINMLQEQVRNSDILHIGLHHIFNPLQPLDLGLLLAPSKSADDTASNAFFSIAEISYTNFNNQLVFLNGCETYRGKLYSGEGVMGVSRAFLNAGAKQVISTLWPVSDRASAEFTKLYYEGLFTHFDTALALSEAQKKMSKNLRFRHPYYWAGYVLSSF